MKRPTLALVFALLLLLALLAGCGSGAASRSGAADTSYGSVQEAPMASPAPEGAAFSDEAAGYAVTATGTDLPLSGEGSVGAPADQKLIYTVNLSIETADYDKSVDGVSALCAQYGGYVQTSDVADNGIGSSGLRYASYTLRIPAEQLDAFQDACSSVGTVTDASRATENATAQYVDLQARLTSLQTEESRLLELLEQAANLDDVVALNDRLADVRYQIESIQSSIRGIDSQVAYSTVNISLSEVVKENGQGGVPRTFGQRVGSAFSSAKNGFVNAVSALGVFLFGTLPLGLLTVILYLLPFAVIAAVVLLIVRAQRRRRHRAELTGSYRKKEAAVPLEDGFQPPYVGGVQSHEGAAGSGESEGDGDKT